jgi:methylmalonyl-CoA mutase N-terminal domain/subunit
VVGVNRFQQEEEGSPQTFRMDSEIEKTQVARLRELRATRPPVDQKLNAIEHAARGSENLMPRILDACEVYATVGEISNRLRRVFGEYRES